MTGRYGYIARKVLVILCVMAVMGLGASYLINTVTKETSVASEETAQDNESKAFDIEDRKLGDRWRP